MPKNLVVCCDGTGNQFGDDNSNVVKLYTCLAEGKGKAADGTEQEQLAYYHPGVGTMGSPNHVTWVGKQASRIAGLGFGYGFRDNLADAYRFLMDNYAPGDRIFLFGFSRGAYTARALAGAVFMYGLLCPGNEGHLPYLLRMFSDASRAAFNKANRQRRRTIEETDDSRAFRETFSRVVPLHFVGVWDTVSSVGWIYDPVKLLYDGQNPVIRKGRHAISVDERRCFFQDNLWGEPLPPDKTPVLQEAYAEDKSSQTQDIVQAWFAGVHSDVGGSYAQDQSAPAMHALRWILDEARVDGLQMNAGKCAAIFGEDVPEYPGLVAKNKRAAEGERLHESLCGKWWFLEVFPHKYFDSKGDKQWRLAPWPHRREVPDKALLHPSLVTRLTQDDYTPKNLHKRRVKPLDAEQAPVLHPEVGQQLQAEKFGVYLATGGRGQSGTGVRPVAVAALVCVGLGSMLFAKLRR